jgi:hypothetical protein
MKYLAILGLLVSGCGGSDDEPVECSRTDRSGTYLVQMTETSGNCGPIPDQLGRLDDAEALPAVCAHDAADRWSDGDCKFERAYSCLEDGVGPGYTSSSVAVTEQQDSDGGSFTGLVTITVFDAAGAVACKSTYELTATRQ